jgi:hypothetical protein
MMSHLIATLQRVGQGEAPVFRRLQIRHALIVCQAVEHLPEMLGPAGRGRRARLVCNLVFQPLRS